MALFAWTNGISISRPSTAFAVSAVAAGISLCSLIIAGLTYAIPNEQMRRQMALIAYILLLLSVGLIIMNTGQNNSPFLILWVAAAIFSGIIGSSTTASLFVVLIGYTAWSLLSGRSLNNLVLGIVLAGLLPLIISYVLWHGKSTNEKTKERALHELANELDQVSNKAEVVIGAISDGVIAINNQGQIELINPAAQRIVGWGNQDALNLDYKSVLHLLTKTGGEVNKADDPVFQVLSTNKPIKRNDLQLQTNSGKKLATEIAVSPIGYIGSGAIIVFRDITKEQAEGRAQAEFISTASHEMRTPVASIEGYLGLILNPATATIDNKARDFAMKAHEAAQHLGRLFQDLLDVTKAEDGRLSNNPKVINIIQFTGNIIDALKPRADQKSLRLFFKPLMADSSMKTLEPIFYVDVDVDHLREVLSNLLENAIKYTPKGEVVINVNGNEDSVVISIADSGIGIPAEDIPHLFQKFYRVDSSDTREIGGTGLGLYLVRRLVEAMGGRVWVESEYKRGSTFYVELPRISHEAATRIIESDANESGNPNFTSMMTPTDNAIVVDHQAQALAIPIIPDTRTTGTSVATPQPPEAATPVPAPTPIAIPSTPAGAPSPMIAPVPPQPVKPITTVAQPVAVAAIKIPTATPTSIASVRATPVVARSTTTAVPTRPTAAPTALAVLNPAPVVATAAAPTASQQNQKT